MNTAQILDAGLHRHELTRTLAHCGLWSGGDDNRYRYTLSPCVYAISKSQREELELLARNVYASLESLDAKLTLLASGKTHLSKQDARFLRLAKTGTKNLLSPREGKEGLPPVVKVDLVQDTNGNYQVAEVDAYNPRGLGYLCLLEMTLDTQTQRYAGIETLRSIFAAQGKCNDPKWFIIVSEFERYYEPAFGVLARALKGCGIEVKLVREKTLAESGVDQVLGDFAQVLCIPESINCYPKVRVRLMERYNNGTLHALFPPKAYLGSKGFLPYLSQQESAKNHIPRTALVSVHDDPYKLINPATPAVLKATVSSGMKQVLFSDLDTESYNAQLVAARKAENATWVLQEQVPQVSLPVSVYAKDGSVTSGDYYFRVIAHITKYGILDVAVTGRPDRKVHGAPDCIQLPSVFV